MTKSLYLSVIVPNRKLFKLNIAELWRYRDLIYLFVKRDFVSTYKQTILGPLWFFIQPLFTSLVMSVVFGTLAGISTDGSPKILFYMAGNILWDYFSSTVTTTSKTFITNQSVFGKVYFPRLTVPISYTLGGLLKLGLQFMLFMVFLFYYVIFKGEEVSPNWMYLPLIPVVVFILAGIGLGFGIIVTSLTTKYRDLNFLLAFGIQLFMYISPVVYPISLVKLQFKSFGWLVEVNPLSSLIETFRFVFIGVGEFSLVGLVYSFIFMVVLLFVGMIIFNKTEQNFIDTV